MSWNNIWIGFMGGGFGASAIVGGSYYCLPLYNMGLNQDPLHVAVFGRRLGLTLQAEAAAACCIMTGVPSGDRFERMESSGVDWALGAGFNISATVQNGSEALNALVNLAVTTVGWSLEETAKNLVRSVMGDVEANASTQNFVLLPTPASLSIGAGIWYEWSDVLRIGHNLIWQREPPQWGIETMGGGVKLRMQNIPMRDGETISLAITHDVLGPDDYLEWETNGMRTGRLHGVVWGQKLYPLGTRAAQSGGPDGISLSDLAICGRNVGHVFSMGTRSDEVVRNDTLDIGVNVMSGALELFTSDDYCEVRADARGRIVSSVGGRQWRD